MYLFVPFVVRSDVAWGMLIVAKTPHGMPEKRREGVRDEIQSKEIHCVMD